MWIVDAPSNLLPYISDSQYMESQATLRLVQKSKNRTGNVELVWNVIPENVSALKQVDIMVAKTLRNKKQTEKLFATYGSHLYLQMCPV